jgi:CheY-like chemotaxis protein
MVNTELSLTETSYASPIAGSHQCDLDWRRLSRPPSPHRRRGSIGSQGSGRQDVSKSVTVVSPHFQTNGDNESLTPNPTNNNSHQRILVVDDEKMVRQLNSKVLILSRYEVDTAEDGDVAWKALQTVNYGLLITDNQMPKVSGVELIKKCRCERMTLPIILSSGTRPANTESLQLAAILLKPFTGDQLVKTVKEVLRGQLPINTTPNLKQCSRRLLAYEAAAARASEAKDSAAARVLGQLRGALNRLTGTGGFSPLVFRAMVLAGAEVPWLRAVETKADGSVEGLEIAEAELDSRTITEGETVLVSQLLGLVAALIGPALTLTLLQTIWPTIDDLAL